MENRSRAPHHASIRETLGRKTFRLCCIESRQARESLEVGRAASPLPSFVAPVRDGGSPAPARSWQLNSIGVLLRVIGDYAGAINAGKKALEISTRIRGADHPDTLMLQFNVLSAMQSAGENRQEVPLLLQDNLARTRKVLGNDDRQVAYILGSLASSWKDVGEFARPRRHSGKRTLSGPR
jgi:hypothetical protein